MMEIIQACGQQPRGRPFISTPPGPQFCEPARGGAFRTGGRDTTDVCGRPVPSCIGGTYTIRYPTCFVSPPDFPCPQEGYRRTTYENCVATETVLTNLADAVVVGTEVICMPRSGLPGQVV
jgi:hypothetical protein